MFMKPIPIGSSPARKDAQEKDGKSATSPSDEDLLLLSADDLLALEEAEEHALATARARLAGTGMLGTLLNIKV